MNEKEVLLHLQGEKVRGILGSLISCEELITSGTFECEYADRLYHALVPLLVHNHYKIRSLSFAIVHQLLDCYEDYLSCPDIVLSSCILSLQSVNRGVNEAAISCITKILHISDCSSFWPEIAETVATNRSTEVRLKILSILVEIADRIPLKPILVLLDDPKAQIRKAAREVIDAADPERVREAFTTTKLSYETAQALMRDFNFSMQSLRKGVQGSDTGTSVTMRGRAAKLRKAAEDLRDDRRSVSLRHGSPVSYSAIARKRKVRENESISSQRRVGDSIVSEIDEPIFERRPAKRGIINAVIASEEPRRQRKYSSRLEILVDEEPAQTPEREAIPLKRLVKEDDEMQRCCSSAISAVSASKAGRDDADSVCTDVPVVESDRQSSVSRKSVSRVSNAPLGKIIRPPRVSLPVEPRDLSKATWLEKISFLEMLKDCLAKSARFKQSPAQIVECVMTTSIPEHKRVVFLIPPILSEIILHHPEVLRAHLNSILTFTLNTMCNELSRTDSGFNQFLSVLFVEADPCDLVDKALKICDKTTRQLPCHRFIKKLYKVRDDILLPFNILSHLMCWMLNTSGCDKLILMICVKEFKAVQRYGANQTPDIRKKLLPFMKIAQNSRNHAAREDTANRIIDIGTDPNTWKKIIDEEIKKGSRADIPLLTAAMVALPLEKAAVSEVFKKFLLFVAKLPMRVVTEFEESIVEICVEKFYEPRLLVFLDEGNIDPEMICGLSRCIWNCPSSILEGSEEYLGTLYSVFRQSIGPTRIELSQIFLAIYQKTHISVLDLEEIFDPHRKLISDLMSQFEIVQS